MAHTRYSRPSTPWLPTALGSLAIMSLIEWLKHVIWPGISTWESHIITILLTTTIICVAARLIFRYAQMHSEAQSLMASIVESSDDGIIGQTLDGTVVSWNKGAERIFGYAPDEVIGLSNSIIVPSDRLEELPMMTRKTTLGEHINQLETIRIRKDGERIDVSVTVSPIVSDTGGIIGASAIVRDISERRRVQEELRKSNEQLHDLYGRLQSAREEERTRIAREIHDEFGQALTALKIDLAWIRRKLNGGEITILEKIENMSKSIVMTIGSIKRLSSDLRPAILDDFGLDAAIEWQAEEFQSRTGTRCEVVLDVDNAMIGTDVSTTIFRILQEAMTNIMRHASATKVLLELKEEYGELTFTVRDDGRGISNAEIANPRSYGLMGIRERVYSLGGAVEIAGVPGEGTVLCVRIPLEKRRNRDD
jgi:two-component system, NarL family, sensor histidine kinase UhpB